MKPCIDPLVGKILAGWRYDISGITPEMRGGYEAHLKACEGCRSRQRMHRRIDIGLWLLASLSALVWVLAFFWIRHYQPLHAAIMEWAAIGGFLVSALLWIAVALSTPAPMLVLGAAIEKARVLNDKLPEKVREHIPEEIRNRIEGQ